MTKVNPSNETETKVDIFFYQNELHILLTKTNVYRNNFKKDNKTMTKQIQILNNKFGMLRQHR